MRILLAEDDRELADYLRRGLEEDGYASVVCFDGSSALEAARAATFDAIVLDVMLPYMDGFEVTRRLRADDIATPIVLLTGRDAPRDVVKGLDSGADDYLTKPFSFDVLLARLRARIRGRQGNTRIRFADLSVDRETHEAWRGHTPLALTRTEFAILECLISAAPRVVPRQRLIDNVWGSDRDVANNSLDVFMRFLRTKIEGHGQERLIHTVRGVGYCLRVGE